MYRNTNNVTLARIFKTVWFSTLLTDVAWRFVLNIKLLRKSWDGKRWVWKGVLTGRPRCAILYDIDVEQVSGMNLKLSSAKRVETEGLICQLIFCLFLCGCARQNAGRWHGLAFYAERQAFTEILGCQEVGLKGGLDRWIRLCEFCMVLMSSKLAGWALNCRLPRGGSERVSWQVDQAVWILYGIDV